MHRFWFAFCHRFLRSHPNSFSHTVEHQENFHLHDMNVPQKSPRISNEYPIRIRKDWCRQRQCSDRQLLCNTRCPRHSCPVGDVDMPDVRSSEKSCVKPGRGTYLNNMTRNSISTGTIDSQLLDAQHCFLVLICIEKCDGLKSVINQGAHE